MKYLIANWKAELDETEIKSFLSEFVKSFNNEFLQANQNDSHKVATIICPPFPFLKTVKEAVFDLPNVYVGAQCVSQFSKGPNTGEVTASMLKDFAQFVIVGHSERRKFNNETETDIFNQLQNAKICGLKTILCIRDVTDKIHDNADVIAYEPVSAIGTGIHPSLEEILSMKQKLSGLQNRAFIYGGSVDETSLSNYAQSSEVDGFLVGKSSTKADIFLTLLRVLLSKK